jgi:hypothetical protein
MQINLNLIPEELNLTDLVNEEHHQILHGLHQPVNFLVDDIPLDQLVGADEMNLHDNLDVEDLDIEQQPLDELDNQNTQIGMVLVPAMEQDPVFRNCEAARAVEATNLWTKYFCNGNPEDFIIKIPANWAYFFTSMLLSPDNFGWASDFLSSSATACIFNNQGNITFSIPKQCPVITKICDPTEANNLKGAGSSNEKDKEALIPEIEELDTPTAGNGTKKKRAARRETPIVESQVRRSERVKKDSNGFKPSGCSSKKCICCSPSPPTLSVKVIKNLGVQFCKMDAEELTDEALLNKKRKADPVVRKKSKTQQDKKGTAGPTGRDVEHGNNDEDDS